MPYLLRRPLLAGVLLFTGFLVLRRLAGGPPRPGPSDIALAADGRAGVLRGRVLGPAQRRGRLTSHLVEATGWRESPWGGFAPARGRVAVTVPGSRPGPEWGDEALFWGRLRPPRGPALPGAYDERRLLGDRRVFCRLSARAGGGQTLRTPSRASPLWWVVQTRRRFARAFQRLGPEARAIVSGLVLGENPSGFAAMKEDFRRSGTVHLLVASGTNVAFVLWLWWAAGRWVFFLPRRAVLALGVPLAFFYAFLAGADPPVLRAAVMGAVGLSGLLMGRVDRPVHLVGFAALVLLSFNPQGLFHLGFQMSFAATLGLALGMPAVEAWLRGRMGGGEAAARVAGFPARWRRAAFGGAVRLLAASLLAQAALAPLLIHCFGRISLVGPAANLLAVPWGGVCMFLGAGLFAADLCALPGAGLWAALTEKAALGLWKIAAVAGRPAWAEAAAPWTTAQAAALGIGTAAGLALLSAVRPVDDEDELPPRMDRRRKAALAGTAAATALAVLLLRPEASREASVVWPGDARGESAAVVPEDGAAALVNPSSAADVTRAWLPFLRRAGARVRWVVFTRPPKDGPAVLESLPGAEALCAFDEARDFPCRAWPLGRALQAAGGSWRREVPGALSFSRADKFLFLESAPLRAPPGPWTAVSVRPRGPARKLARALGGLRAERWVLRGRGGAAWESSLPGDVHRPGRDGWLIRRAGAWETDSPNIVKSPE